MSASPAMAAEPAPPAHEKDMRAALAWETGHQAPDSKSTWVWLWEAIQGDFNDNRSTGQIAFDAGIAFIPVIDQICDVRDIIANSRAILQSDGKHNNTWIWVSLALTLIGLFPSLGSLVKGVLKIFFLFVRRYGGDKITRAVGDGLTWAITFLRKREVQQYLRRAKVDEVFKWLADHIKVVRGRVNQQALLSAFDGAISVMNGLLQKVTWLPSVGKKAQATMDQVRQVRHMAERHLGAVIEPMQDVLDAIVRRLEVEHLIERAGVVNVHNIHFRGTLPEAQAVRLMKTANPPPAWLSKGRVGRFPALKKTDPHVNRLLTSKVAEGWPDIQWNVASFHKLRAEEVTGPARFFRIGSPANQAMGDCWVSEEVFHKIISAADPKTAWRKNLAVWPDWNANGQFEVFTLAPGEKLKVWRGEASSQIKDDIPSLDAHLEGGWEQVVIKTSAKQRLKTSKGHELQADTMRVFKDPAGDGQLVPANLTPDQLRTIRASRAHARGYTALREQINDAHITGPFDTGWPMTDFDVQLNHAKVGLPALPGQVTKK
ncbi:MAG: hypothetical protein KF891_02350 [Rhizobacter sp.]|nr:hypothetical protein [Rhizobacter sp.]